MERRKPTYGSAIRMAELLLLLSKAWRPVPVKQICDYLRISHRTAQRYRSSLNQNLHAEGGGELVRVLRQDGVERWWLADQEEIMNASLFRILSMYATMVFLKGFEGTIIQDGIRAAWETLKDPLKPSVQGQLELLEKKIRFTGFGIKDYRGHDEVLRALVKGLVHQRKVQIVHGSRPGGTCKYRRVCPYTLLLHRDALYLHAHDELSGQVRTFAVDRIREGMVLQETFRYPAGYDPAAITEGSFGVFGGSGDKPTRVVIEFKETLREYLTTRRWHPSQKFSPVARGRFTLELQLTSTEEIVPWVLQFGGDARVLVPARLADRVRKELLGAYEAYGTTARA